MRRYLDGLRAILSKRQNKLVALMVVAIVALGADKIYERSRRLDAEKIQQSVIVVQRTSGNVVGAGVVLLGGRYALTADHVIDGFVSSREAIVIRYKDGLAVEAQVVKRNTHFDIALLILPYEHVKGLRIADDKSVKQGDHVTAHGHPFGITWTMSEGIVSRKSYYPPTINGNKFVVWTTAWIEGGSSGGPLVNQAGEIVGLVMAFVNPRGVVLGAQHLNICVSSSEILRFLESS